jgi:Domain of unknown function (DUF3846)
MSGYGKAVVLRANPPQAQMIDWVEPDLEYDVLSGVVDGYIEAIPLRWRGADGCFVQATMWLNEEGKLRGLPHNEVATGLFVGQYNTVDRIVGDVIITGGADEDGNTLGLPADVAESFAEWAAAICASITP